MKTVILKNEVAGICYRGNSYDNFKLLEFIEEKQSLTLVFERNTANIKLYESVFRDQSLLNMSSLNTLFSSNLAHDEFVYFLPNDRIISEEEKQDCLEVFKDVLSTGEFTSGHFVKKLEQELSSFLNKKYVILCSSGTDATIVTLHAMGIQSGDEVIMPANSFAATENAVLASGGVPVLVDTDPHDYLIDTTKIEEAITSKTRFILPVHLYGKTANMKTIREIADKYSLKVIEDACQAIGAIGIGEYGDAAILSFNPYKNFAACGKGGGVITKDEHLAKKCHQISYHGFEAGKKNFKCEPFGFNSKIDNLQAAFGLARLQYLCLNNFKRLYLAKRYIANLKLLFDAEKLLLPELTDDNVWHLFPIQLLCNQDRDQFKEKLYSKYKVQTDIYYPVLTHQQNTLLRKKYFLHTSLPNTELTNKRVLHLPLYPNIALEEQDKVLDALHNAL